MASRTEDYGDGMTKKYAEAGVDIGKEASFVKALTKSTKQLPGIFAKYFYVEDKVIGVSTDGVGSKLICYQMKGNVKDAAYDLAAMNLNDLASERIPSALLVDSIAVHTPDEKIAKQLGEGLREVCEKYGIILAGGETASLPDQIREDRFDWVATVIGVDDAKTHKKWIKRRENLEPGLEIVGIESSGIHSNGLTLARKLLEKYSPDERVPGSNKTLLEELTTPTCIYSNFMMEICDSAWAFIPITGGGFTNVNRILKDRNANLDAEINIEEKDVLPIFKFIQQELEVSDEEMFKVFNMGYGLLVITDEAKEIRKKSPWKAKTIGEIEKGSGKVVINYEDKVIEYSKYG